MLIGFIIRCYILLIQIIRCVHKIPAQIVIQIVCALSDFSQWCRANGISFLWARSSCPGHLMRHVSFSWGVFWHEMWHVSFRVFPDIKCSMSVPVVVNLTLNVTWYLLYFLTWNATCQFQTVDCLCNLLTDLFKLPCFNLAFVLMQYFMCCVTDLLCMFHLFIWSLVVVSV